MKVELRTASITHKKFLKLHFPPNDIKTKRELRNIPKIRQNEYSYEVRLSINNVEKVKELGFIFSKGLTKWWEKKQKRKLSNARMVIEKIPGLGGTLYPYQLEGVNYIDHKYGRALIADEMGLGKTVQALAWVQLRKKEVMPILVICPSSLKINWVREAEKWTSGLKTEVLNSQTPYLVKGNFVVINYDVLSYWDYALKKCNFKTLIVDEAHYLKNNKTKRTKAFKKINRDVDYLIALTGTPIENRPIEIFNIVNAIDSTVFPNYIKFALDYCDAKKGRFGWDMSGSSNTIKLNEILTDSIMIRRKKKDVLKDLPPKQLAKVTLEITNEIDYRKAENEFVQYLKDKFRLYSQDIDDSVKKELQQYAKNHDIELENEDISKNDLENIRKIKLKGAKSAPMFTQIETLKQLAVYGKMDQIIEWVAEFLDSGEKLVIFAINKRVINELMKYFKGAVKIDGSVSMSKRQKVVDAFQNNPNVRLLIGNIKAAGVGYTFTAASNVAIIQFPWSPGELSQAIDRVHRITQIHQVTAWMLVGKGTIEEKIIDILIKKEKIINEILDGEQREDESVLSELINSYR